MGRVRTDRTRPGTVGQTGMSPFAAGREKRPSLRWRHGFEPRWDCEAETAGERPSSAGIGPRDRPYPSPDPANIPHDSDGLTLSISPALRPIPHVSIPGPWRSASGILHASV
jgi:hypothetical protein